MLLERERVRQRLLLALEALSRAHRAAGRYAQAIDAAMLAVGAEPLRESAQRELLQSHLAEENWSEGRRVVDLYRTLLRREIGVEPHPDFEELLDARLRPHSSCEPRKPQPLPASPCVSVSGALS